MIRWLSIPCVLLACAGMAGAQVRLGDAAADFPPGTFADGKSYSLADFQSRAVVIYFFEAS
jgi:hypothetical protein